MEEVSAIRPQLLWSTHAAYQEQYVIS